MFVDWALGDMATCKGFLQVHAEGVFNYDLTDAHKISVGAIDYLGGDHLMWDLIKNNDRLFAEISFQM